MPNEQLIKKAVELFEKEFELKAEKVESGKWYDLKPLPTLDEIKLFYEKQLRLIASKSAEIERKKIIDDVMIEIDGHYDNPNLAGNLEEYFGITYQEWEDQK